MRARPTTLPTLETERLLLRSMEPDDAPALFGIYGDPEVMRYASDEPFSDVATVSLMLGSVAQLLAAGASLEWAVVEKATGELVGTCGLHSFDEAADAAEVGCMLARAAWGRGIMREALPALFAYGQDKLEIQTLRADIDEPNLRSIRLFTALGFGHARDTTYERRLRSAGSGDAPLRSAHEKPDGTAAETAESAAGAGERAERLPGRLDRDGPGERLAADRRGGA